MKSKIKNASILITGANGGMGIETIKLLIKEQPKRIALACRTKSAADYARNKVFSSTQFENLEPYSGFDMNSEEAITKAVDSIPAEEPFDIIFLQAGGAVFTDTFQYIEYEGKKIERTSFQNAFGGYITLKHLRKRGLIARNARIVFAGGEGARGINGMIDKPEFTSFEELENYLKNGLEVYNPMNAIGISKLVSAMLSIKLSEEDEQHEYIWFSPGLTSGTNGLNSLGGIRKVIMKNIAFPIFTALGFAQTPVKAAKKYVDAIAGRIGITGDVIGAPEGKTLGNLVDQKPMNSALTNHRLRNGLYDFTTQLMGTTI